MSVRQASRAFCLDLHDFPANSRKTPARDARHVRGISRGDRRRPPPCPLRRRRGVRHAALLHGLGGYARQPDGRNGGQVFAPDAVPVRLRSRGRQPRTGDARRRRPRAHSQLLPCPRRHTGRRRDAPQSQDAVGGMGNTEVARRGQYAPHSGRLRAGRLAVVGRVVQPRAARLRPAHPRLLGDD